MPAAAALLINEAVSSATDGDWVELTLTPGGPDSMDIQSLYVTMYYGTSEPLGTEPITIYSYDKPETPWDDRFVVVYLTKPGMPDETDATGDTNSNGIIEIYCNNYSGSLWNTDCVVSVTTSADPSSGTIYDFVAYSNMDGTPNSTISGYIEKAVLTGAWQCASGETQKCCVDIGPDGLNTYQSIARISTADTNSRADFTVTNFQTPGKPNILNIEKNGKKIFRPEKKHITIVPGHSRYGKGNIRLSVFETCSIKIRIFTSTGLQIFESPLYTSTSPGFFEFSWDPMSMSQSPQIGFYIVNIEGISQSLQTVERDFIYFIIAKGSGVFR